MNALLIKDIKRKKELFNLDDKKVNDEIIRLENKFKDKKSLFKAVRKNLRDVYGLFQVNMKLRNLDSISSLTDIDGHEKVLKSHLSTKERLLLYPILYDKIFAITGVPQSILDLGCGLNPLSYPFMKAKVKYIASEFNQKDCDFISKYFKKFAIDGHTLVIDLIKDTNKIPTYKVDVVLLFKVLDTLESIENNCSKRILKECNTHWIVVSFPRRTTSGKRMTRTNKWFTSLVTEYQVLEFDNEIFYLFLRSAVK